MAEIKSVKEIGDFVEQNQEELLDMSLSEYLRQLLDKYKVEKSAVFRRAKMSDSNYGYELFRDDSKRHPETN